MSYEGQTVRIGSDIGGTFTDIALEVGSTIHSTKVLTNYTAPEQAILDGIEIVLKKAGLNLGHVDNIVHGTTLATNALIERRGAKTAFVTTEGFRDVIEMRTENRFEQYDLNLKLPAPLIPRCDRYVVAGRVDASGAELVPLDEDAVRKVGEELKNRGFEAIAIGFIHSYVNAAHEQRARDILAEILGEDVSISISSDVSPQMREFERFNTVCANAYVRPQMKDYLSRLGVRLKEAGADCPLYMIHSGGGLIAVETAIDFPVRLVESGPAGGAIFAADFAAKLDQQRVLSYDMGGTTAKICLIDDEKPKTSRTFEVARTYRFKKGSGMPISIPVIEMVEIGAGGGSLASLDAMGRIQVGPESAASEPGPACYGRGGNKPAVTDGDVMLGKIDPDNFAGGEIRLSKDASQRALEDIIANPLDIAAQDAAFGVVEMVDENMANAARVHAVESGKNIADYSMIAFGGAAPLHAARLCEKLNIHQCIIPPGAGVGSAIGFLRAPFAYEAVQSLLLPLSKADIGEINRMLAELVETAQSFVLAIDKDVEMETELTLFMRYAGQGWEIPVEMPCREMSEADRTEIQNRFHEAYARFFGRTIDALEGLEIEIVSWSVKASTLREEVSRIEVRETGIAKQALLTRKVFDPRRNEMMDYAIIERSDLGIGEQVNGPAVVVERETSVVVTSSFDVIKQGDGSLLLTRKSAN